MKTVDTRYGTMNILDGDSIVSKSLALYGEWAQSEIEILKALTDPGDCCLDIGAFLGTHTLALAQFVGSSGKVIAFEPRPEIYEVLLQNVRLNHLKQVEIQNLGLSDVQGSLNVPVLKLDVDCNFGGLSLKSQHDSARNHHKIELVRVDDFNFSRLDIIKLDVEGMEVQVLKGAQKTLRRCSPIVFTECNDATTGENLRRFFEQIGYACLGFASVAFSTNNFNFERGNVFGSAKELSLVGVPLGEFPNITSRLVGHDFLHIKNTDDIVALMLLKPQYPTEVLIGTHVTSKRSNNSLEYTPIIHVPRASIDGKPNTYFLQFGDDNAHQIQQLSEESLRLAKAFETAAKENFALTQGLKHAQEIAFERIKQLESLTTRFGSAESALSAANKLVEERLKYITELTLQLAETDQALEQTKELSVARLNELQQRTQSNINLSIELSSVKGDLSSLRAALCKHESTLMIRILTALRLLKGIA